MLHQLSRHPSPMQAPEPGFPAYKGSSSSSLKHQQPQKKKLPDGDGGRWLSPLNGRIRTAAVGEDDLCYLRSSFRISFLCTANMQLLDKFPRTIKPIAGL